jgi:hypothetical protein
LSKTEKHWLAFKLNQMAANARRAEVMLQTRLWPLDSTAASIDFVRPTLKRNYLQECIKR